ncbi:HalOD1 output domain-containing protein [Halorussus litoreus]|uniref:HalOD1 output domain-containing protein n=1 Tax=Halorussus litoreus TaxID=1710536 RepID=UPI000E274EB9|nr:HalOD1 output domain-containing protein [Halorussus litoreus]
MSEKQSELRRETNSTDDVSDDEPLSQTVVTAVATASGTDPTAIDPLAESIDPDALDALFDDRHDGTTRDAGTVRFSFFGYDVVATGDGCVSVVEPNQ